MRPKHLETLKNYTAKFGVRIGASVKTLKDVPEKYQWNKKNRKALNACAVGIEIEAENYGHRKKLLHPDPEMFFTQHAEGSLRNQVIELVTPPIYGDAIVAYMDMLDDINENYGLVYSPLAGLHVHLNMVDSSLEQIANLTALYLVLEPLLFIVSGNRKNSIYCVPLNEADNGVDALLSYDVRLAMVRGKKYMAFNYLPLFKYGTIEFRHAAGTSDTNFILLWTNLLMSMWKYAHDISHDEFKAIVYDLHTEEDYVQFCRKVFGEHAHAVLNIPQFFNLFRYGLCYLKEKWIPTPNLKIKDFNKKEREKEEKEEIVLNVQMGDQDQWIIPRAVIEARMNPAPPIRPVRGGNEPGRPALRRKPVAR